MSKMKFSTAILGAALAAIPLFASGASANTYNLSLSGIVANGSYDSFTSGSTHYDQWYLSLTGLDSTNQISVVNGDTIDATLTLDQPFTIPASQISTTVLLFIGGSSFPSVDTGTSGSTTFYYGGAPVAAGSAGTGTHGTLANSVVFFPPNNTAITFDSVQSDFTITNLSQSAVLNNSELVYSLTSNVPEPSTWALMLLGFAGLGFAGHRRGMKILSDVASA
jgi:hypothetical protein